MRDKIQGRLQIIISSLYGLLMFVVFTLLIFFSDVKYARSGYCIRYMPALVLIFLGLFFLGGILFTSKAVTRLSDSKWRWVKRISFVLVFVLQVVAVESYYFRTDWDVSLLERASDVFAHDGQTTDWYNFYLSMYPNNVVTLWIFTVIKKIVHMLGLHSYEYVSILMIQIVFNSLTGYLTVKLTERIFRNRKITYCAFWLYFFLIGLSPWVSIPYTDSMGLIVPITILYLYFTKNDRKHLFASWILIGILTAVGVCVKPQLMFVTIAIVIKEIITFARDKFTRKALLSIGAVILCAIVTYTSLNMAASTLPLEINEEGAFSYHHYLMMGVNPKAMGEWSEEDVNFSNSFSTKKERQQANMEVFKERVDEMGLTGLLTLYARKILTNYNDGTFCWSGEGVFFNEVFDDPGTTVNKLFRGMYYRRDYVDVGIYNDEWSNFEQMIWFTVLLMGVFSIFDWKNANKNIIAMSIIGLSMFQVIFEARARYLFTYSPFYILLALYGINVLMRWVKKRSAEREVDG